MFHVKISDNAAFSLWMFVFAHIPAIFSFLDIRLKTTAYFFDPPVA